MSLNQLLKSKNTITANTKILKKKEKRTLVSWSVASTVTMESPGDAVSRIVVSYLSGLNTGANRLRSTVMATVAVEFFDGVPPSYATTFN